MTLHDIIRRPLVTEKGVMKKETELTLCFEVAPHANKVQVKAAVEKLFKVKVDHVRTCNFEGKERRRGMRHTGLLADEECGVRVTLGSDGRRCDYRTEYDGATGDRHKSHELPHDRNPPH